MFDELDGPMPGARSSAGGVGLLGSVCGSVLGDGASGLGACVVLGFGWPGTGAPGAIWVVDGDGAGPGRTDGDDGELPGPPALPDEPPPAELPEAPDEV